MLFEEKNAILFDNQYSNSCIYFLIKDNIVVYVGKTTNGKWRIKQHKNDKNYDKVYIIKCKSKELMKLEDDYMMKYKPKYNILHNVDRKNIITIYNQLRKEYKIGIIALIDYIKKNNIKIEKFHNVESIKKTDYLKIKEHFQFYEE